MGRLRRGGGSGFVLPSGLASLAVPDGIDNFLQTEMPAAGASAASTSVNTTWQGGFFRVPRQLDFNRLVMRAQTNPTPGELLVVGLYQSANGLSSQPMQLVQSYTATIAGSPANFEMVGSATLLGGIAAIIWGTPTVAGAFTLSVYNTALFNLANVNNTAGTRPLEFTTAIAVTNPPPPTLNAVEGGDVTEASADVVPIVRVRRV